MATTSVCSAASSRTPSRSARRGLRDRVRMDTRRRPEPAVTLGECRRSPGILEVRGNRDDTGDARLRRRIENGGPILIEAAVGEMAVTVEHNRLAWHLGPAPLALALAVPSPKRFWISSRAGEATKMEEYVPIATPSINTTVEVADHGATHGEESPQDRERRPRGKYSPRQRLVDRAVQEVHRILPPAALGIEVFPHGDRTRRWCR